MRQLKGVSTQNFKRRHLMGEVFRGAEWGLKDKNGK